MKRVLAVFTTVIALAFLSAAQTGGSSGSQSSSGGQTSATDHGAMKTMNKGGGSTITGCLSGPNSEGVYTIKHHGREVEVGGLDDLSKHVGHEVKLHGSYVKSGSDIGEKEEAGKEEAGKKEGKEEKGERHFKVSSIDHISDTCTAGASGKHKKGSSSGMSQPSTPPK
jgi:hypothetical protein